MSCTTNECSQLEAWGSTDRVDQKFRDGFCSEPGEYEIREGGNHPYMLCLTHTGVLFRHRHELNRPVSFTPNYHEIHEQELP